MMSPCNAVRLEVLTQTLDGEEQLFLGRLADRGWPTHFLQREQLSPKKREGIKVFKEGGSLEGGDKLIGRMTSISEL